MSENVDGAPKAPKAVIEQAAPADAFAEDASNVGPAAEESPVGAAASVAEGVAAAFEGTASAAGSAADAAADAKIAAKAGRFQDATIGLFEGVGRAAWAYADAHPHATLYGIVGFILAVLILVIGLWDTIVIAAFVAVGTIIGQMVDGDNAVVNFLSRLMNGGK